MIGLEKSFGMMYSNLCLNSRETVPLKDVYAYIPRPQKQFLCKKSIL